MIMKKLLTYLSIAMCMLITNIAFSNTNPNNDIPTVLNNLLAETALVSKHYAILHLQIETKIKNITLDLRKTKRVKKQLKLLILKQTLKEQLQQSYNSETSDISKIRYLKGLQIIRILYEKTLALDHHFSSVTTFNEINKISNPNHYPEFLKLKEVLKSKPNKKIGFDLTAILGSNIYTSVIHSFISMFSNTNVSNQVKEENIKEIECILDFTLNMHNDLNTIYFETAFLQKSNDNIMRDLERLFKDFTKPIKYSTALKECRENDDWDTIKEKLNGYLKIMNTAIDNPEKNFKVHTMQINLEFPIDRLLQFITQYNTFIDQGAKFYEKFAIMLDSYENEKQCSNKIPIEYKKLKENITISINKFNTAYKPVEINGSKMKEVLYGINEYE